MRFYYSISSAIWNPLGSSWSPGLPLELNKRTTPPVVTSRTINGIKNRFTNRIWDAKRKLITSTFVIFKCCVPNSAPVPFEAPRTNTKVASGGFGQKHRTFRRIHSIAIISRFSSVLSSSAIPISERGSSVLSAFRNTWRGTWVLITVNRKF